MVRLLLADLRYSIYSKLLIGFFLLFLSLSSFMLFLTFQKTEISYKEYLNEIKFAENAGMDINEELEKEPVIIYNNDGMSGSVENPLPYFKKEFSKSLYSISNKNIVSLWGEQSIFIFPILAVFMGNVWAAVNIKNKTLRNRVLRNGRIKSYLSNRLSGFLIILLLMLLVLIISFIIQLPIRSYFESSHNINILEYTYKPENDNIFLQAIVAVSSMLFYYELGSVLGNIFKGNPVIPILVCVYLGFVSPVCSYDTTNIFNNIAKEVFEFAGNISLAKVKEINNTLGVVILLVLFMIMLITDITVSKKRSAY